MDTPERSNTSGSPLTKFEDSPVFSFINNLSPIQPLKSTDSVHTAVTYQSLNFASLSSIFSSPHANPPRETRILTTPSFADLSKQENFLGNVGESSICSEVSDAARPSKFTVTAQENCTITCPFNVATVVPPDQCSNLPSTSPHSTQHESGSPNHITTPCYVIKIDLEQDVGHTPAEFIPFVQNSVEKQKNLFARETGVQENHPFELNKDEVVGCDWENFISDDAEDLLIFNSSIESEAQGVVEKAVDNDGNSFVSLLSNCTGNDDDLQKTQPDISHGPCVHNVTQDPPLNCNEGFVKQHETDHPTNMLSGTCQSQVDSHQHRGLRRRCLVFEVAGVSKRNICGDSNLKPSTFLSSKGKSICDSNNSKPTISPSVCALPGIGLHLNTLATASKDRMINKETLASGKNLISMRCSVDPFPSTAAARNNSLRKSLASEEDLYPSGRAENLYDAAKDTTIANSEELSQVEPQSYPNSEELSQGTPKKKRRKSENGGEKEGCKRCNCKKSKCLKLYCECFAAGVYCSEPCSCQGCLNKPIHEETVLATRKQIESRNPLAFAPKVIRTSDADLEMGDDGNKTPASARHKRGCNCKKSNCLKKYCECYQGGVGCSISCRCEGCKNAFGRKDGILHDVEEVKQVEEETGPCDKEKESQNDDQQTANVQIDEQQFSGNILSITPYQSCRLSVELPFLSSAKPPRPTKLSIGHSPRLFGSHMFRKSEILLSQHKLEGNVNATYEDDTPAILRLTASPTNVVKIASPSRKRVSPPHNGVGLSPPNRKGCRKLILKSIPSFPSLNNDVHAEYPVNYSNSSSSSSTVN